VATTRVLLCLGLAGALVFVGPGTAMAAGTLDQQVITGPNDGFAPSSNYTPAQVFTAGITGQLDQVDLYLNAGFLGSPSGDLTVQIWTVSGGQPSAHVAGASATVKAGTVNTSTWVQVPISAPSVAGTQYAIVLSTTTSTGDCPDSCWNWLADKNDPYAGGGSFYSASGGAWVAQARDQMFKTYVEPMVNVQVYLAGVGDGAFGSVTSSPGSIDCGSTCLQQFLAGSTLTLTAHPAITATFGYWHLGPCDGSHNPVCSFTVPTTNVETVANFYGIPATPVPTAAPTSTPKPTVKPTATASTAPSASIAASIAPSAEPSAEPSPSDTVAASVASLTPGATPGPTTAPIDTTSGDGGSSLPLILLVIATIGLAVGAAYAFGRGRRPASPPPSG
jgi:hypothetical protein